MADDIQAKWAAFKAKHAKAKPLAQLTAYLREFGVASKLVGREGDRVIMLGWTPPSWPAKQANGEKATHIAALTALIGSKEVFEAARKEALESGVVAEVRGGAGLRLLAHPNGPVTVTGGMKL